LQGTGTASDYLELQGQVEKSWPHVFATGY